MYVCVSVLSCRCHGNGVRNGRLCIVSYTGLVYRYVI